MTKCTIDSVGNKQYACYFTMAAWLSYLCRCFGASWNTFSSE